MVIETPSYNKKYVPKKETIEFFIWLTENIEEENKPAKIHFMFIDFINSEYRKKVLESFRGSAKSTLVGIYYILYLIDKGEKPNFGEWDFALYVMDTVSQVSKNFEQISYIINNNPKISAKMQITKEKIEKEPTLHIKNKRLNKTFYLLGFGAGQKIRGVRKGSKRPQILIVDDLENDELVETAERRQKLKFWFYRVLLPALHPTKYDITVIGTPLHQDSLIVNLENSKSWRCLKTPIYQRLNNNFYYSAWEDRFPIKKILQMREEFREDGLIASFNQEYLLNVIPEDSLLFDINKINFISTKYFEENIYRLTYYISVDLAISEKESADYTSIAIIGVDKDLNWYLVDGFFGRIKPDETIERVLEFANNYKPEVILYENVAFQKSFGVFMKNEMMRRGLYYNIETITRTKSKLSVIKGFQPIVEAGKFFIVRDGGNSRFVNELLDEMQQITNDKIYAKHDDLIDSIAMLTQIDIIYTGDDKYDENYIEYNNKNPYIF